MELYRAFFLTTFHYIYLMIIDLHHPHDSLFKAAFKNKKVATDFLKSRLPKKVLEKIDLATLKVENSSFIDQALKKTHSDLVLSVNTDKEKAYLYFLIELQMSSDKNMVLRFLEYNTKLWREHTKKHKTTKLPTILNLLIYAGAQPYKGEKTILEAFQDPVLFQENLTRPFLINLQEEAPHLALKDGGATLLELVLREGQKRDFCNFLDTHQTIGTLISQSAYGVQASIYMMAMDRHKAGQVLEKIRNLAPETKQAIMSGLQRELEQREQRGINLGMEKGKAEGRAEGINLGMEKGKAEGINLLAKKLVASGQISKEKLKELLKEEDLDW